MALRNKTFGGQRLKKGTPPTQRPRYRPALTEAGYTLLIRARRVSEEANAFRDTAHSLVSGFEAELTVVLDFMFPMPAVVEALRDFTERFTMSSASVV